LERGLQPASLSNGEDLLVISTHFRFVHQSGVNAALRRTDGFICAAFLFKLWLDE